MNKVKKSILYIVVFGLCLIIGCSQQVQSKLSDRVIEISTFLDEGRSKKEIDEYLEVVPHKVKSAMNTDEIRWRYEVEKSVNYLYTGVEAEYDTVDIEAMQEGTLQCVLICAFDDKENLTSYTLYYTDEQGRIIEIRNGGELVVLID